MPRPPVFPPPLKSLRGRARCWLAGQWHYLGKAGSEESHAAYAALLARYAEGGLISAPPRKSSPPPALLTVADVAAAWLREEGPAACTERGRELEGFALSLRPLVRLFGARAATDFGPAELRKVREDMAHALCRIVVNQRVARIKRVWCWAETQSLVPAGRYAALAVVKSLRKGTPLAREGSERRPSTLAEVCRAGRELARRGIHSVRAALLVQWWTGMRSAEVRTMRAADVSTSGAVWVYRPRQHKTDYLGHSREVAIGPRARAVLAPWLTRALATGPDAPVFPPSRCRRGPQATYTCESYAKAVHVAAVAVGLPAGWSAYCGRHATRDRVARLAGPEAAQHVLGQRSPVSTALYGVRTDHGHAADVQRRLG